MGRGEMEKGNMGRKFSSWSIGTQVIATYTGWS